MSGWHNHTDGTIHHSVTPCTEDYDVIEWFDTYLAAEDYADKFKGDTQTESEICVIEIFRNVTAGMPRFAVTFGDKPICDNYNTNDQPDFEVQYTA